MSTKTTAEPYLTDEHVSTISNSPFPRVSDAIKHVRDIYEADRQRLLAENASLRERLSGTTQYETVPKQLLDEVIAENAVLRERLALLDGEEGEPVAWMTQGNERQFMWSDHKVHHTRHDNEEVREYLNEKYSIPLYTRPSPTADAALRSAAQVAADALDNVEHGDHCASQDSLVAGYNIACTCGKDTALSGLLEFGITPTEKP